MTTTSPDYDDRDDDRDEPGQDAGGGDDGQDDDDDYGTSERNRITTLDYLAREIAAIKRQLTGGGVPRQRGPGEGTRAEQAEDKRREIREELAALRKQERAERARGEMSRQVKALTEAVFEKPPRELRRVEKFMKWDTGQ